MVALVRIKGKYYDLFENRYVTDLSVYYRRSVIIYIDESISSIEKLYPEEYETLKRFKSAKYINIKQLFTSSTDEDVIDALRFFISESFTVEDYIERAINVYLNDLLYSYEYDIFYPSYFGGRNEVFKYKYVGDMTYLDINSAYAYILSSKIPIGEYRYIDNVDIELIKDLLQDDDTHFISNIEVYVNEDEYLPALPVRLKKSNIARLFSVEIKKKDDEEKTIYPTGLISGLYHKQDIQNLLEITDISDIRFKNVYLFKKAENSYLKDLALSFYKRRFNKNKAFKNLYKQMLVILYGKLASHKRPSRKGNYVLGGYITAQIRRMLYKKMLEYKDYLLYCDTDGLLISKKVIIDNKELGEWSVRDYYKEFYCYGQKKYKAVKADGEVEYVFSGYTHPELVTIEEISSHIYKINSVELETITLPSRFENKAFNLQMLMNSKQIGKNNVLMYL